MNSLTASFAAEERKTRGHEEQEEDEDEHDEERLYSFDQSQHGQFLRPSLVQTSAHTHGQSTHQTAGQHSPSHSQNHSQGNSEGTGIGSRETGLVGPQDAWISRRSSSSVIDQFLMPFRSLRSSLFSSSAVSRNTAIGTGSSYPHSHSLPPMISSSVEEGGETVENGDVCIMTMDEMERLQYEQAKLVENMYAKALRAEVKSLGFRLHDNASLSVSNHSQSPSSGHVINPVHISSLPSSSSATNNNSAAISIVKKPSTRPAPRGTMLPKQEIEKEISEEDDDVETGNGLIEMRHKRSSASSSAASSLFNHPNLVKESVVDSKQGEGEAEAVREAQDHNNQDVDEENNSAW